MRKLPGLSNVALCVRINFSGRWNADLSRSSLLGQSPKAIAITIEHSETELREEVTVTKSDASQERLVFQCNIDSATDASLVNGRAVRGRAKWEGKELVIETWIQAGGREMFFRDCWSLSSDGKTLSMEHRDDAWAGQVTILDNME
jgi:hypothetical protein